LNLLQQRFDRGDGVVHVRVPPGCELGKTSLFIHGRSVSGAMGAF
jgi:hypothetical protein